MSGREMVFGLRLELRGHRAVIQGLNETRSGIKGIGDQARSLWRELNGFSIAGQLAGLAGGTYALKNAMEANLAFERGLLEMKHNAGMTYAQLAEMRKKFIDGAADALQTPQEMMEGGRAFARAGETFDQIAIKTLEAARAATVFRATVEEIANMDFDITDKLKIDPRRLSGVHNMLYYHGNAGRFEAPQLARQAPELFNAVAAVGIGGERGLNFTGALTQVLMKFASVNDPGKVATLMQQGLGHIVSPHYVQGLAKFGIDIKKYAPGGKFYGEGGVDGLLALADAMKAKGLQDPFQLGKAGFADQETNKFFRALMQYTDNIRAEMKAAEAAAGKDQISIDLAEMKEANFGKIKAAEIEVAKMKLSELVTGGTGTFAKLAKWAGDNKGDAAALGVGLLMAWRMIFKNMSGGKGGPNVPGFPGAGGVQHVFVTNWPKGLLGPGEDLKQKRDQRSGNNTAAGVGGGSGGGGGGGWKGKVGQFGKGLKSAFKWTAPFALGLGAWDAFDVSQNPDLNDAARMTEYGRIGGSTAGGLTGAAIGGGIGSLFGGFGAIPGAFIGGAVGDWAGGRGGKIVIENILHIDGREVARSVNKHNAEDGRRQ